MFYNLAYINVTVIICYIVSDAKRTVIEEQDELEADENVLNSDSEDDSYKDDDSNVCSSSEGSISDDSMEDDVPNFLSRASYYVDAPAVDLDFLSPNDTKVKKENILQAKNKSYRCKTKDELLFHQMLSSLADCITPK